MAPHKRRKLLSHTRPQSFTSKTSTVLSSRATRTIIRRHHNLHKGLAKAQAADDTELAESLQSQLQSEGGLARYQQASILGQSAVRGGDSSRILLDWLQEIFEARVLSAGSDTAPVLDAHDSNPQRKYPKSKARLLEVGALRTDNACALSGWFDMVRIDLHSQNPDILEQDFMERPVPQSREALDQDGFDIVSLSLVLNYVGDAADRGEMLKRVAKFLRASKTWREDPAEVIPGLFVVLPAPCVCNSRYLNEQHFTNMMQALGYTLCKKKYTSKLVYFYWHFSSEQQRSKAFPKRQVAPGGARNNFAIVLR